MLNFLRRKLLMEDHVCPWWLAYSFDNKIRRILHSPEQILGSYVKSGMTVIDIGCGMGYFSIEMAKMIGENGSVISVDMQQKMLNILIKRAQKEGMVQRIFPHLCKPDNIGITKKYDFALTFWMVHEVQNKKEFLQQIFYILKPSGKYLLVEPKFHTNRAHFEELLNVATEVGFNVIDRPRIRISRAALFEKPSNK